MRLVHASLLGGRGSTTALLRQRETEFVDLDRQQIEVEAQETVSYLEHNLRTHQDLDQIVWRETRALLAEREVGFLQALLVGCFRGVWDKMWYPVF